MDVKQAIERVDQDHYMKEDGRLLSQTTNPKAIENGLCMLDVQKGQNILEIGTGSGFSTALLATLAGNTGSVTSVDIDPKLTTRAKNKLVAYDNITCVTGDGRNGFDQRGPYDRIIAWTTPDSLPIAWKNQLKDNGIIVTPFQVRPLAACIVTVRLVDQEGDRVSPEGYIPMTDTPVINFYGYEVQAEIAGDGNDPFWASSLWMQQQHNQSWVEKFLKSVPMPSRYQEAGKDLRPYLLGTFPEGFTTAYQPDYGPLIGYSTSTGFAFASEYANEWMVSDLKHAEVLDQWWNDWQRLGKPGYEDLLPFIDGRTIKIKFKGE